MKINRSNKLKIIMKNKLAVVLIVAALALIGFWVWQKVQAPVEVVPDTTAAISEEVESLSVTDLESEFQAIDADLNAL